MKRAIRWMFTRSEVYSTVTDAIAWWEIRRIPFNLIMGLYGLICLGIMCWALDASGRLKPGEDAVEPVALMMAPIAINLLYTLGWFVEVPLRLVRTTLSRQFGPWLLILGTGLGFALCSVPPAIAIGAWMLR